jgi:hypothetical protein
VLASGMGRDYSPTATAVAAAARARTTGAAWLSFVWMRFSSPARAAAHPGALGQPHGRWGLGALLGAWLGAVAGPACTLELRSGFSCGDGYWNREAGEKCDPEVPESYENACVGTNRPEGIADCDPELCTIINDREQCGVCGDGRVDEDLQEECDGDEHNGMSCPSGEGALQCDASCKFDYSACELCGNHERDPGEECDPTAVDTITSTRPDCITLASPDPSVPYGGGKAGPCTDECRWDRITCNYCGNGQIDGDRLLDSNGNRSSPEICDATALNQTLLNESLSDDPCTSMNGDLRSQVVCRDDCTVQRLGNCCVNAGKRCPDAGEGTCCYALETEGFIPGQDACAESFNGELLFEACLSDGD